MRKSTGRSIGRQRPLSIENWRGRRYRPPPSPTSRMRMTLPALSHFYLLVLLRTPRISPSG